MAVKPISRLDEFMSGAITERFNQELAAVLRNALDPNTHAKAKRSVIIKIDVMPNETRTAAQFTASVSSKLAPVLPFAQDAFLRQDDAGNIVATEATAQIPGQIGMDGSVQQMPSVLEFPASL